MGISPVVENPEDKMVSSYVIQLGEGGILTLIERGVYLPAKRDAAKIRKLRPHDRVLFYFTKNKFNPELGSTVCMESTIRLVGKNLSTVKFNKLESIRGLSFWEIEGIRNKGGFPWGLNVGKQGFNICKVSEKWYKILSKRVEKPEGRIAPVYPPYSEDNPSWS